MGIKGKSGGFRTGAGRKTLKTEREIKEMLQVYLPQALEVILNGLKTGRSQDAWKLIDKFVPDAKPVQTEEQTEPLIIRLVPESNLVDAVGTAH